MTEAERVELGRWKLWATPERTEQAFEEVFYAARMNDTKALELIDLRVLVAAFDSMRQEMAKDKPKP